jgi:hypothetical protein
MKSMHRVEIHNSDDTVKTRKPYVAPACSPLPPEEAKRWLLSRADINDPEVRYMLECIEELQTRKSS